MQSAFLESHALVDSSSSGSSSSEELTGKRTGLRSYPCLLPGGQGEADAEEGVPAQVCPDLVAATPDMTIIIG
eukprot:428374-Pelagomonas_calceolata.AAC.6